MSLDQVIHHLQAAIEASVYIAPTEPGLTAAELWEVGKRLDYKDGEIGDAMPKVATQYFGDANHRLLMGTIYWRQSGFLIFGEEPDHRKPEAFDFVFSELNELVREIGQQNAQLDRKIIVERAAAKSISRHDVEVAITLMVLSEQLNEKDGALRFRSGGQRPLPSASRMPHGPTIQKTARTRVWSHVEDVIARRTDTRPQSAEALPAFAEQLGKLGYGPFRLWWNQTVAELGRTDPNSCPLAALVLAAALLEGALTFTVKHARSLNVGIFGSTDFDRDPRTWRIEDLVAGAVRGGAAAILDAQSKNRADGLIRTRQRIHAGRMLSEFPSGVPDLRPEEAREAKAVAEQVVRCILDWLARHPPG
jgi:hypothetical protein